MSGLDERLERLWLEQDSEAQRVATAHAHQLEVLRCELSALEDENTRLRRERAATAAERRATSPRTPHMTSGAARASSPLNSARLGCAVVPPLGAKGAGSDDVFERLASRFTTPRGTPRAEALRATPRSPDTSPPPSARRCFVCRCGAHETGGTDDGRATRNAAARPHQSPGGAMDRLATSKLRCELNWGKQPLAELRPSSKFVKTPAAELVHRLEGLVWALEQRVTQQQGAIRELRVTAARRDVELRSQASEILRHRTEAAVIKEELREADGRAELLEQAVATAEAELRRLREAAEAAGRNDASGKVSRSIRLGGSKAGQQASGSNWGNMTVRKKATAATRRSSLQATTLLDHAAANDPQSTWRGEQAANVRALHEAADEFERRWSEHVARGGLKERRGAGAASSPRVSSPRVPGTVSPRRSLVDTLVA